MQESRLKPKLKSRVSFQSKQSFGHVNESGHFQRPINRNIQGQIDQGMTDKLYNLMASYIPKDINSIQTSIVNHVEYTLARTRFDFKALHCYLAVAHSVRDRLIESFNDSHRAYNKSGKKRVYYMSLQFLIGRCLLNALTNLNVEEQYKQSLSDLGYTLERISQKEVDPALGNGGLGRLAACFLDSLATLQYPAWGYGIRYQYGIFRQIIKNGHQVQIPDYWLQNGNPWEIQRVDVQYKIHFYGKVRKAVDNKGNERSYWEQTETIIARAYDTPIPGYATFNTIGLRLWKSLPLNEFDFVAFNSGDYYKALQARQRAQYITSVLYPNDSTEQGKQLRLKQQYLLVSATIQDIVRRHKTHCQNSGKKFEWKNFSNQAAIQLNDTHPALAIVQLLRIMIDQQHLDQQTAWNIIYDTFSYTNHTVLPEALQKWSVQLLNKLLPRHLQLIYLINHFWLTRVSKKFPNDPHKMNVLSLVQESNPKRIRMANLCVVGSHKVNGVAFLHSQLLKKQLFKDFCQIFPNKFINKTNGVTTRRWVVCANPRLSQLYTQYLKSDVWILDMTKLRNLEQFVQNTQFRNKWRAIKQQNKKKLADWIKRQCKVQIQAESLFDIQVKRIHQYKRQLMNILYVIYRYITIKAMTPEQRLNVVARTVMFSGKAAPAYTVAKNIIKLINEVSYVINNDASTNSLLKVVFLPNYNVSNAEIIIPASDISQHISTAGTEASGTSNMKFVMNGGLIIGTMDGANVQIYEQVGQQNIFIFGARVQQINELKRVMSTSSPDKYIPASLQKVFQVIRQGMFGQRNILMEVISTISNNNDWYLISADFDTYIKTQQQIDEQWKNTQAWTKKSILNGLRTGKFSSDRTIKQYAEQIWNIKPCKVAQEADFNHVKSSKSLDKIQ